MLLFILLFVHSENSFQLPALISLINLRPPLAIRYELVNEFIQNIPYPAHWQFQLLIINHFE